MKNSICPRTYLQEFRANHDLSQQQVADILEIQRPNYARIELGTDKGSISTTKLTMMFCVFKEIYALSDNDIRDLLFCEYQYQLKFIPEKQRLKRAFLENEKKRKLALQQKVEIFSKNKAELWAEKKAAKVDVLSESEYADHRQISKIVTLYAFKRKIDINIFLNNVLELGTEYPYNWDELSEEQIQKLINAMDLGFKLWYVRQMHHYTRQDVIDRTGVTSDSIYRCENGDMLYKSRRKYNAILIEFFKKDLYKIFGYEVD